MQNENGNNSQIKELRKAMFDQIERLNDPTLNLEQELKRANAIKDVGTVIINSVKVELDFERTAIQKKKAFELPLANENGTKKLGNGK